jgi:hypothetical protein
MNLVSAVCRPAGHKKLFLIFTEIGRFLLCLRRFPKDLPLKLEWLTITILHALPHRILSLYVLKKFQNQWF